jgi:hypothetical protein
MFYYLATLVVFDQHLHTRRVRHSRDFQTIERKIKKDKKLKLGKHLHNKHGKNTCYFYFIFFGIPSSLIIYCSGRLVNAMSL